MDIGSIQTQSNWGFFWAGLYPLTYNTLSSSSAYTTTIGSMSIPLHG